VTELGKSVLLIASLLIIPGLVLQGYSQMYEMPSQEDMERMMPKPVSGTYTNLENGVSVDFPSGWSGTVTELPDIVPGEWMVFAMVMDADIQAGKIATIILSIGERLDDEIPEPAPPVDGYDVDCSYIFAEKITLDGKTAMKLETECIGTDLSFRMLTYVFATSEKYVAYVYSTNPASDFENHIDEFEDSVKTLSISNLVDLQYEIPDDLSGETRDDRKDTRERIEERRSEGESQTQIDPPSLQLDTGPSDVSIQKIPEWIKKNAEWWAQGAIGDSDFVSGLQFLIKEGIMKIPTTTQGTGSGSNEIPEWIKKNAEWWAQGAIGDSDFVSGIQFLIKEGIMTIPTTTPTEPTIGTERTVTDPTRGTERTVTDPNIRGSNNIIIEVLSVDSQNVMECETHSSGQGTKKCLNPNSVRVKYGDMITIKNVGASPVSIGISDKDPQNYFKEPGDVLLCPRGIVGQFLPAGDSLTVTIETTQQQGYCYLILGDDLIAGQIIVE